MNSHNIFAQRQQWPEFDRYIFMDEFGQGSVQLELYIEPHPNGTTAYLYALWVNKTARQSGLATKLMDAAENKARSRRHKSVVLDWSEFESPRWTREWYERRGYKEYQMRAAHKGTVYYLKKNLI